MPNAECYQPSPAETRAAEATMDARQQELTETREDALFEGKKKALESIENTEETAEFLGFTLEDVNKLKEFINERINTGNHRSDIDVYYLANAINKSPETTERILDYLHIRVPVRGGLHKSARLPEEKLT